MRWTKTSGVLPVFCWSVSWGRHCSPSTGLDHPTYLTLYRLSALPTFSIHHNKIVKVNTW